MADNMLPLFAGTGKFYVYVYRDPRPKKKLEPIYVGKGTAAQGRADVHWKKGAKNPLFKAVLGKIKALSLAPVIEIVAWFDDEGEAFACEQKFIAKFGLRGAGGTLCNLLVGDTGGGWTHSEETRIKLSIAMAGVKRGPSSPETRSKISAAQKGKKKGPNPEHSLRLTGRKLSPDHCAAISAGNMGRVVAAETIGKIRISNTGKKRSAETRENLRVSHLGNVPSEETCLQMSASQKLRWESSPELKLLFAERMKGNSHALTGKGVHSAETRQKVSAAIKEWWRKRKEGLL